MRRVIESHNSRGPYVAASSPNGDSHRRKRREYDLSSTTGFKQTTERIQRIQLKQKELLSATSVLRYYGFITYSDWELGAGHYSKVYRAINNEKNYAVKVIKLKHVGDDFKTKFLPREISCWQRAKHPNICRLMGHFGYQDHYMYMIMEYCGGGDLLTYIQNNGPLSYYSGREWMYQLLDGICYLHRNGIAHRDIKAENVMIHENQVKLTDFGFSCQPSNFHSSTYCGSKAYSSPEVLAGVPYDTFKGDVWAFGALCYVAMTNSMPYRENVSSNHQIIEQQRKREYKWPVFVPQDVRTTIDFTMTFNQNERPTAHMVKKLPFFAPYYHSYAHSTHNAAPFAAAVAASADTAMLEGY